MEIFDENKIREDGLVYSLKDQWGLPETELDRTKRLLMDLLDPIASKSGTQTFGRNNRGLRYVDRMIQLAYQLGQRSVSEKHQYSEDSIDELRREHRVIPSVEDIPHPITH